MTTTPRLLKVGVYLAVAAALVIAAEHAARVASAQLGRTGVASPVIELMFFVVCAPGFVLWIIEAILSGQGLHEGWGTPPTIFEQVIWWTGNVVFWALMFVMIERLWRWVRDRLRGGHRSAQSGRPGDEQ